MDSFIGGLASGALLGHFQGALLCTLFLLVLNSRVTVNGSGYHNIACLKFKADHLRVTIRESSSSFCDDDDSSLPILKLLFSF